MHQKLSGAFLFDKQHYDKTMKERRIIVQSQFFHCVSLRLISQFGHVDRISEYSLKTLQHIKKYNITTMLRPKMLVALSKGDEYLIDESRRLIHKYEVHDKVMIDGKEAYSIITERHDYSLIKIQ